MPNDSGSRCAPLLCPLNALLKGPLWGGVTLLLVSGRLQVRQINRRVDHWAALLVLLKLLRELPRP